MLGHIIIDGPDAVGKTTLANYLNEKYGFDIMHSSATDDNDFPYHHNLLMRRGHNVYDRFMGGEYVYPKIYGREPKLDWDDFTALCKDIINTNSLYIIVNCTKKDVLFDRLAERKEFNYFAEMEQQIDLFRKFAWVLENPYFEYDNFHYVDISEPDGYDKLYKIVTDFIEKNI